MAGNAGAGVLGWRVARPRAVADRLILAASFSTILLATLIVSAGPMYATAVTTAGLQSTIASAPPAQVGIEVGARGTASDVAAITPTVDAVASDGFTGPADLVHGARSDSFAVVDVTSDDQVVKAGYQAGLDDRVEVVAGALATGPGEAVLHAAAAEALGLVAGDTVELAPLGRQGASTSVTVTGTFQPLDGEDRYWWDDTLLSEGSLPGNEISEAALFLFTRDGFTTAFGGERANYTWRIAPDASGFDAATIDRSRALLGQQLATLADTATRTAAVTVDTGLDDLLADTDRALGATRAAVIVTTTQLGLLAVYALVLATGLLVESRQVETALLRSRGATPEQVGAIAAVEGLLLVLPAVIIGPLLAVPAVRALGGFGALGGVGLQLDPAASADAFVLASLAGIACLVALVVPAVRSARTYMETRSARGRGRARGLAQRAGLDIILAVLALLGLWQLRRYGTSIDTRAAGVEVDPFLVVAPAIALAAGSVLAMRLVPIAGSFLERRTAGRRALPSALGSWQLARRPQRYARSALLLLLAVAIGTFGATYAGTWTQSQQAQADLSLGADVVVVPSRLPDRTYDGLHLDAAYRALPGVEAVTPRYQTGLPSSSGIDGGVLVAVEAEDAAVALALRDDVADGDASALLSRLAVASPIASLDLPDGTTSLRFTSELEAPGLERVQLLLVVRDGRGLLHRLAPVDVVAGAPVRDVEVDLAAAPAGGAPVLPAAPASLVGLEVRYRVPLQSSPTGVSVESLDLRLGGLRAVDAAGSEHEVSGPAWTPVLPVLRNAFSQPQVTRLDGAGDFVTLRATTGTSGIGQSPTAVIRLLPGPAAQTPTRVPAIVTPAVLEDLGIGVGDQPTLVLGRVSLAVEVVGTLPRIPSELGRDRGVLVDAAAYAAERYEQGGFVDLPSSWLLAVDPERTDEVVGALRAAPFDSRSVDDRVAEGLARRTDPVPLGLIGALTLGGLAAAAFALVGYLASTIVAARERLLEFALLRAVGASTREVRGWLTVESVFTVGLSVVVGGALGLALGWLVLPSLSVARDGTAVVPGPVVQIPWAVLGGALATALVALLTVPRLLTRALERANVATVLRAGEDR